MKHLFLVLNYTVYILLMLLYTTFKSILWFPTTIHAFVIHDNITIMHSYQCQNFLPSKNICVNIHPKNNGCVIVNCVSCEFKYFQCQYCRFISSYDQNYRFVYNHSRNKNKKLNVNDQLLVDSLGNNSDEGFVFDDNISFPFGNEKNVDSGISDKNSEDPTDSNDACNTKNWLIVPFLYYNCPFIDQTVINVCSTGDYLRALQHNCKEA